MSVGNSPRASAAASLVVNPGRPLRGEAGPGTSLPLPGDKSLSHRAALFSVLACGESRAANFLVSGVTGEMLGALDALAVPWKLEGDTLVVSSPGLAALQRRGLEAGGEPVTIHCGNSATTLRMLAGALAALGRPAVLDGSPGLRRRPMGRIVAPLLEMGVSIRAMDGAAPLSIDRGSFPLRPLIYRLPVASAQVKSCLLLAALAADGPTTLVEPGPSRDHTERMLASMGASVASRPLAGDLFETVLTPPRPLLLSPLDMRLPGDFSAAAFLIVAALVTPGSDLVLRGVGLNPTRTGLLDALQEMGAGIQVLRQETQGGEPVGDLRVRWQPLQGIRVEGERVVRMIDEFPIFAVAAACARGATVVAGAQELRLKESDRISALCQELRAIGVEAVETPDGFILPGGQALAGGQVDPHGDHRLAMSLAVAGLVSQRPVIVRDPAIIGESFPRFAETLVALGAQIGDRLE